MDITDMYIHEFAVEHMDDRDSAGDPVYSGDVIDGIPCRAEFSLWIKTRFHARELDSFDRISTSYQVFEGDRIWLPEADTGNVEASITVDRIDKVYDVDGCLVHYIIHL